MIHRGERVLKVITQKNINKTSLAEKIGISRQQLYNQLDRADMTDYYIHEIGRIIDFDFRKVIPDMEEKYDELTIASEPPGEYKKTSKIDLNVSIDGNDENLKRLFDKLRVLNETLKKFSDS